MNPVKSILHAAALAALLTAVVCTQSGCGTMALHNLQVASQYEYEAEMEARGLIPLRRTDSEIWAESWYWKVPLAAAEVALYGFVAHRALKDRGGDDRRSYSETHHYPPAIEPAGLE